MNIIPAEWFIYQQEPESEDTEACCVCTQCGQIGKHYGTVNGRGFWICYEPDRTAISCVTWKCSQ